MSQQNSWVNFYGELVEVLLGYKKDQTDLLNKLDKVFNDGTKFQKDMIHNRMKTNKINPFTVIALINLGEINDSRYKKIISNFKNEFNMKASDDFSFKNMYFFYEEKKGFFIEDESDDCYEDMWDLFEKALNYSDKNKQDENDFTDGLNKVFSIRGLKKVKISSMLHIISPYEFIAISNKSINFTHDIPEKSNFNPTTGKGYMELLPKIIKQYKDDKIDIYDHIEKQQEKKTSLNDKVKAVELYNQNLFLDDVYITKDEYENIKRILENKKNIIIKGAAGVGKTYLAEKLAYSIIGEIKEDQVKMIQLHPSYSYEELIEGYRPSKDGVGFELQNGILKDFCELASKKENSKKKYYFIIDELGRGNIGKVLGELITLIENNKRDKAVDLLYSKERFSVPSNLYFIGLLNTADRGIGMLDYSLIRKFAFCDIIPAFNNEGFKDYSSKLKSNELNRLISNLISINNDIANDQSLGKDYCIGHSYLCNLEEINEHTISNIVDSEIIPLLNEYWFDNSELLNKWTNILRGDK